ncbi:CoA transferase [Actinokineospora globicatena]|uniref:CoA transferase n=1 Tax=Actinokineospora globicatena TaxID=103729 RepID=UPI00255291C8|nr:CoA transferase [Actinokineospora globicatena]
MLDLTHVIAGPVCGRTLAAHGASVLHVGAEHLPVMRPVWVDTSFGKRSTWLDLRDASQAEVLRSLWSDADVMIQSYRPDSLAARGFGPADAPEGTVLVSLSAYGHSGPWRGRRGFDSLLQLATGIAHRGDGAPVPLPAQALDHGTGWLAASGVMTALRRRAVEGGTWHVRVSLARTARLLDSLGWIDSVEDLSPVDGYCDEVDGPLGRVRYLRVPGGLPGAPPRWDWGPGVAGGDLAEW